MRVHRHKFNLSLQQLLPSLVISTIWILLVMTAANMRLDDVLYDWLEQSRPLTPSKEIVIVSIDTHSLETIGSWPWPRELHASLLDRLGNARAVGLDLIFAEPTVYTPETDQMLADAIRRNKRVVLPVLPEIVNNHLVETTPLPQFSQAASGLGHIDTARDSDGVIRRTFLYAGLGAPRWPSFAEAILATAKGHPVGTKIPPPITRATSWVRADEVLIPFPDNENAFTVLPYQEVLAGEHQEKINGAIVLVGVTASGLGDNHLVPSGSHGYNMPGVAVAASLVNALLTDDLTYPIADHWLLLLGLFALLLTDTIALQFRQDSNSSGLKYYLTAIVLVILISIVLQRAAHFWLPTLTLALLLLLLGIIRVLLQHTYFRTLALTDGLTTLANRRYFDDSLSSSLLQAQRLQQPLALMIIDIDFFKPYNDHYGHSAGDDVLKRVGGTLKSMQRHTRDVAARIGGEEFALLLPNTSEKTAVQMAEQLRKALQSLEIDHIGNPYRVITCSIGTVVAIPTNETLPRDLYEAADIALYESKRQGRNRTSLYTEALRTAIDD